MRRRDILLVFVTGAALVGATGVGAFAYQRIRRGWRTSYESIRPDPRLLPAVNQSRMMAKDLALRPRWRRADVDELFATFPHDLSVYNDDRPVGDGSLTERAQVRGFAHVDYRQAVAERLRFGPAIDDDQVSRLEEWLLSFLEDDDHFVRWSAVSQVFTSGLARRPDVRTRIESMIETDPDPEVRLLALQKLEYDDETRALEEQGKAHAPKRWRR